MKILIVNTLYYPYQIGGAEKSVQSLAEEFSLLGHSVLVITLAEKESEYELNNVKVKALKIQNNYWPFSNRKKGVLEKLFWHYKDTENSKYDTSFKNVFNEFNPEVLLTNNLAGFSTKVWRLANDQNIKTIHVLRDYYLQCPKTTKYKNNCNCKNQCFDCQILSSNKKKNSKEVDYVIGISKYILKDHLEEGYFGNAKFKIIHNGFRTISKESSKKALNKGAVIFGYIGQINKSKGVEMMLKSFSHITNSNWKLLIAGLISDDYKKELRKINDSKNISYLGYINSDVFYKKIDVLIVPSLWNEPFGRVVIEALNNKKPVLGSKVGGITELLNNNQKFLVRPSEQNFTNVINKIIETPDVINSFVFDEFFLDNFSIEKTTKQYINVFKEITKTDENQAK